MTPYLKMKYKLNQLDGAKTALVLCGFGHFGDIRSIRHRLDAARAQVKKLTSQIAELEDDARVADFVQIWRRDIKTWEYAISRGEKLLESELAKLNRKKPSLRAARSKRI